MATKIVTKNSSTASAVPTASDLVQGELAVNVVDKRLFTENNAGAIVELGTNPSTIDINAGTIDGAVIGGTTPAAITGSTVTSTGNIVVTGTVDGRDVAADGTKLDGIEASADVTDTLNVTAAGALMDSELTSEASVKALNQGVATTDSPAFVGLTVDTNTLYVDSTNNRVGIGTTSPSTELHIASASPVLTLQDTDSTEPLSTYVSFKDSGGNEHGWMGYGSSSADSLQIANAHDDIILYTGSSGTAAERMRIDSSGNVGIGTSSPDANLVVYETATSGTDHFAQRWRTQSGGVLSIACSDLSLANPTWQIRSGSSEPIAFNQASNERMRIDSSGKVGIGTSSPSTELHVDGSITYDGRLRPHSTASDGSAAVPAIVVGYDYDTGLYHPASNTIGFSTGGSERMRIDSSGNVGIGTTSPSGRLHLSGDSDTTSKLTAQRTGSTTGTAVLGYNYVGSFSNNAFKFFANSSERMRIDSSGNLLIGRTSTAGSLTDYGHQLYNSGIYYLYSSATGNGDAFRMYDGNGTLRATIDGDGDYTDLSDVRAKENIVNAPSVLSTINDLQVRSFTWKVDGRHQTYGFVAQELNEAIPEAVSLPEEEDGMWGVKHAKLVPVLVKAIQEQQTLIESLTDRIAALEE